jgi:hypothetical protein
MISSSSPASPTSSAARLAASVDTHEPAMDRRMTYASPAQHREREITAALFAAGLQPEVDASVVQRVARGCPAGADVAAFVSEVVEAQPRWFTPTPKARGTRSADRLAKTFTSGGAVPPSGLH